MKQAYRLLPLFAIVVALCASVQNASAIPAFARRYQMECTMCHDPVPRLNEFGFKFRAAGFRRPSEIGKGEASNEIGDYLSVRGVFQGAYKSTVGSDNNTGVNTTAQNNLNFSSASLYPLAGAFGGHISGFTEFGYSPGSSINVSNAFIRLTYGDTASFWSFRAGLFGAREGYGAFDVSLGASSPLVLGSAAQTIIGTKTQSTLYTPGMGEMGVEAGWNMDRLALRLGLFNGIYSNAGSAQAAIGGSYNKPTGSPSYNSKDITFIANYIVDEHGGGIMGYVYTGGVDIPAPSPSPTGTWFTDKYLRYGVGASYPISGFKIMAGFGGGTDKDWVTDTTLLPAKGVVSDSGSSCMGYFGEVDYHINNNWNVGARYDFFDPISGSNFQNNEITAITAMANYSMNNGLVVILEAKDQVTAQGVDATNAARKKNDYSLTARMFFIW